MLGQLARLLSSEVQWRIHQHRHLAGHWQKPRSRDCNICVYHGYFHPFGWPIRPEALCPQCRSLERHRLLKLWLDDNRGSVADREVLHFAAEPAVTNLIRPLAKRYVSADIDPRNGDIVLDHRGDRSADGSFDVAICSHILEHVDDRAALHELCRILRPGGVLLIMTPIMEA